MAEDDVDRLVAEIENTPVFYFCNKCGAMYHGGTETHPGCNYVAAQSDHKPKRLARIVRELLAELPEGDCQGACRNWGDAPWFCRPCRARALRERLCRLARGEA